MFKRVFLPFITFVTCLNLFITSVNAEDVYLHSKFRQLVSFDKWVLTQAMSQLKARVMPFNLNQPVNHTVDVSFHGGVLLSGNKANRYRVKSAAIEQGVEVSCGLDVSNGVQIGSTGTIQPTVGVTSNLDVQTGVGIKLPFNANIGGNGGISGPGHVGGRFGVSPGGIWGIGPDMGVDVQQGWNPQVGGNVGFSQGIEPSGQFTIGGQISPQAMITATLTPSIQTTIMPGSITKIPIIAGFLGYNAAAIDVAEETITLGGCLGPATVRIYLTFFVKTDRSYNKLTLHSGVVKF